jgi:lipopolysaccharide export system protein LptA
MMQRLVFFIIFFSALSAKAAAQTSADTAQKVVVLERANEIRGGEALNPKTDSTQAFLEPARFAIGQARFVEATTTLDCDTAIQFLESRKIRLAGRILIVRDSVAIRGDEGFYFPDLRKSILERNVSLTDQIVLLNSQKGVYFSDAKQAFFSQNVSLKDTSNTIFSDSLAYFRAEARAVAVGSIRLTNPTDNIIITGGYGEHFTREKRSFIIEQPVLVKIDTSRSLQIDTLIIRSLRMDAFRNEQDSLPRIDISDSVRIRKGELLARSNKARYLLREKLIALYENPIVWFGKTQLTGDSIIVQLKEVDRRNRVDKMFIFRQSFLASKDSADFSERKFNQVSGEDMIITFNDSAQIERAEVFRQSRSLYYTYDEGKPKGANLASGDEIVILFQNNQIQTITFRGGVEGLQYPERFINRIQNLPNFRWRELEKPLK